VIYDVLIAGGGVVGLSAAVALHQRGFSVILVDAGDLQLNKQEISPRVYAINQASQHLLKTINVWEKLTFSRVSPYLQMHIWDAIIYRF
jgi:2-octaprenylphenol hydroxylase